LAKLVAAFLVHTNETEVTISFGNRGRSAMAKTYRDVAIADMVRTIEEAMSRAID
jgi:hypothetical protein